MRRLLTDMAADLQHNEMRVKAVMTEIEALAAKDDVARRLMTISRIGIWEQPRSCPTWVMPAGSERHMVLRHGCTLFHVNTQRKAAKPPRDQ